MILLTTSVVLCCLQIYLSIYIYLFVYLYLFISQQHDQAVRLCFSFGGAGVGRQSPGRGHQQLPGGHELPGSAGPLSGPGQQGGAARPGHLRASDSEVFFLLFSSSFLDTCFFFSFFCVCVCVLSQLFVPHDGFWCVLSLSHVCFVGHFGFGGVGEAPRVWLPQSQVGPS